MNDNAKAFEDFASAYCPEIKEILVLTDDGSASKIGGKVLWTAQRSFLAYVDLSNGELKKGKGRIVWPVDEYGEADKSEYLRRFKSGCIYRLKVRDLLDRTVPAGRLPSFYNCFMVVEILEEGVANEALEAVLAEYRQPVKITDAELGTFELNKDLGLFDGDIDWLDEYEVSVSLDVDIDDEATWEAAMQYLRDICAQQEQRDKAWRAFAAEKLTELANDWRTDSDDDDGVEITPAAFAARIGLAELSVGYEGQFIAYYDDDDMFWGHVITVYGSDKEGLKAANIEG